MPIYDWTCTKCPEERVTEQTISEYTNNRAIPDPCECGGEFQRVIKPKEAGVKGFILLGDSGWHSTEYTRFRSIK